MFYYIHKNKIYWFIKKNFRDDDKIKIHQNYYDHYDWISEDEKDLEATIKEIIEDIKSKSYSVVYDDENNRIVIHSTWHSYEITDEKFNPFVEKIKKEAIAQRI